jgi:hypothetical protein
MRAVSYVVNCFACSAEVGAIIAGRLHRHGCGKTLPYTRGRARCCECGGSLYLEPVAEVIEEQALGRDGAAAWPARGGHTREQRARETSDRPGGVGMPGRSSG